MSIKDRLRSRLRDGREYAFKDRPSYPPFWKPSKEDSELYGVIVEKRPSPWNPNEYLYTVEDPETKQRKTIPRYAQIAAAFESENVDVGDYVLIVYVGEGKARAGRNPVKLFKIAIEKKSEVEGMIEEDISKAKATLKELSLIMNEIEWSNLAKQLERRGVKTPVEVIVSRLNLNVTERGGKKYVSTKLA